MPPRTRLTDKAIKATKAPEAGRIYLWDSDTPGLALRITDRNARSWIVQKRCNGAMVRVTLGSLEKIGLSDARNKAIEPLAQMEKGIDPRHTTMTAPLNAAALDPETYAGAVADYLKREVNPYRRKRTATEIKRTLERLNPVWGSLPLGQITGKMIIKQTDATVDRGAPVAANRQLAVLHRFFRWCKARHLITVNPASDLEKPHKTESSRDRTLSMDELWEVWAASEDLGWPFRDFIRTLILTGARRTEVAGMTWAEIDLEARIWTLPAARSKNGREHKIWLSNPLLKVLRAAPRSALEEQGEEFERPVFTTNFKTHSTGFARAKERLDAAILERRKEVLAAAGADPDSAKALEGWVLHDLRRSFASRLGDLGINIFVIELLLNHRELRSGVLGVYQRQELWHERQSALVLWSEQFVPAATTAKAKAKGTNVVPLKARS